MQYKWNWAILVTEPYWLWLATGLGWTLVVTAVAWSIAFTIGTGVGIARTLSPGWAQALATAYVEVFRNIPLLVQVFLWFFVVPELLPRSLGMWMKRDLPQPEFTTAAVALGLYSAARIAEQVRAAIESIPSEQGRAALATGLTRSQAYRYVLLPRALRSALPTLTSETMNIVKNSSIALVIGVLEITAQARQIENYTFQGFEAFTACTLLYLAVCTLIVQAARILERRLRVPGMIGVSER